LRTASEAEEDRGRAAAVVMGFWSTPKSSGSKILALSRGEC
jgi:hypothetical protein